MPGHFLIISWVTLTDNTEKSKKIVLQIHKNWTNRSNSQFGTMIFCCFYLFEKIISENPHLKAQTRIFANLELVLFTHWEKKEFWKTQINVNLNLGQEKWTFFEKFPHSNSASDNSANSSKLHMRRVLLNHTKMFT